MRSGNLDLRYNGSVCISGLTASGKSTHSHLLTGEFGLTYVSGSQILLNSRGLSPIQPKDFWVTEGARQLKAADGYRKIDDELLRIESVGQGFMFDTSTMPWRHRQPAICIWLESDLNSRVLKSIVSHRGRGLLKSEDYADKINEKDDDTIGLCRELYGIEIGKTLECCDVVLDISALITEPTLEASLKSIAVAHKFVRSICAWYLTGQTKYLHAFERARVRFPEVVKSLHLPDKVVQR